MGTLYREENKIPLFRTLSTKILAMFAQAFQKTLVFIYLFSIVSILSCTKSENTGNVVKVSKETEIQQKIDDDSSKLKIEKIQGKLIYEELPRRRSVRAYKGEEFFLIPNTTKQDKLVLYPSEKVSHSLLASFHNQDVDITAIYKLGTRADSTKVACPLDDSRQCMIQGQGYQVLSIKAN